MKYAKIEKKKKFLVENLGLRMLQDVGRIHHAGN